MMLKKKGIKANKQKIDKDNTLIRANTRNDNPELEERLKDLTVHFNFGETFRPELVENSKSMISSIHHIDQSELQSKLEITPLFMNLQFDDAIDSLPIVPITTLGRSRSFKS